MTHQTDGLTVLKTYPTTVAADLDKALLIAHKIWCIVQEAPAQPELPLVLFVRKRDLAKAAELLKISRDKGPRSK